MMVVYLILVVDILGGDTILTDLDAGDTLARYTVWRDVMRFGVGDGGLTFAWPKP